MAVRWKLQPKGELSRIVGKKRGFPGTAQMSRSEASKGRAASGRPGVLELPLSLADDGGASRSSVDFSFNIYKIQIMTPALPLKELLRG